MFSEESENETREYAVTQIRMSKTCEAPKAPAFRPNTGFQIATLQDISVIFIPESWPSGLLIKE